MKWRKEKEISLQSEIVKVQKGGPILYHFQCLSLLIPEDGEKVDRVSVQVSPIRDTDEE